MYFPLCKDPANSYLIFGEVSTLSILVKFSPLQKTWKFLFNFVNTYKITLSNSVAPSKHNCIDAHWTWKFYFSIYLTLCCLTHPLNHYSAQIFADRDICLYFVVYWSTLPLIIFFPSIVSHTYMIDRFSDGWDIFSHTIPKQKVLCNLQI